MRVDKLPNAEKLDLCKKYFFGGFACLPFLWIVNFFWFFKEARKVPHYPEQELILRYNFLSGLFGIVSIALLAGWYCFYTYNRASWGAFGDDISFVIPKGAP